MSAGRAALTAAGAAVRAGAPAAGTVLVAAALALAAPPGARAAPAAPAASAAASAFVTVRHDDAIAVKGARLGCLVQLAGVICYQTLSGKPRVGALAVTLVAPGLASIARIGEGRAVAATPPTGNP